MSSLRLLFALGLGATAACAAVHERSDSTDDALSTARPGSLDPSFGTSGRVTTSFGTKPFYASVSRAQTDGKIVVAGGRDDSWAVARYGVDGTLDPSFASDVQLEGFRRPYVGSANAIALAPNGQIVLAGDIGGGSGDEEGVLSFRRLGADGTPDTSLDAAPGHEFSGMVEAREVHKREHLSGSGANAVAVLGDGSIVVGGWVVDKDPSTYERTTGFELAKFGPDGKLDTAFEDKANGPLARRTPGSVSALAIQGDGKLVVGGDYQVPSSEARQLVVERHLADGSLDTTFGQAGRAFAPCNGDSCGVRDVVVQPDGKVLVGAWLERVYWDNQGVHDRTELLIVRLTADGQLDSAFGLGGFFRPNVGSWGGTGGRIALQPDGRIVIAGAALASGADHQPLEVVDAGPDAAPGTTYYADPDFDLVLVRATADGTLDATFGTAGVVYTNVGRDDSTVGASISTDGSLLTVVATSTERRPIENDWEGSLSLLRYTLRSSWR